MPQAVSKKQLRLMNAIVHGKRPATSRGDSGPPKSVAAKYVKAGIEEHAPEDKGKEHEGGKWDEGHHAKDKKRVEDKRTERKKHKAKLRKALEDHVISRGNKVAGCIVVSNDGKILLGKRLDSGQWSVPGGHVESNESFEKAALRELKEETGLSGTDPKFIKQGLYNGYDSQIYLVKNTKGAPKSNGEFTAIKWYFPHELPWDSMSPCASDAIKQLMQDQLVKGSLTWMMANEELQKNIIRSGNAPGNTVFEVTHGDSLRLIGNGAFRFLRDAVRDMQEEDFKEIPIDQYIVYIRKHTNDVYSGRITSGQKQIHQFTNKSLPAVTAELMSVFEWYLPEDAKELEVLDEDSLGDDAIEGGINELTDHYYKHNIVNIYNEMENIREEIRSSNIVDIQQVEQKIMTLFNKLEQNILNVVDKHNKLNEEAGSAIDDLEKKLIALQSRIDELNKRPTKVEAYSTAPQNDVKIHREFYPYLTKPQVRISPDGHITISFDSDWTHLERENFLTDLRAKAVKKK